MFNKILFHFVINKDALFYVLYTIKEGKKKIYKTLIHRKMLYIYLKKGENV